MRDMRIITHGFANTPEQAHEGELWQYELKLDGYRTIAIQQDGEVNLFSRNGMSFSSKFPLVVKMLEILPVKRFIVDGEIVALDERGRPSRSMALRHRLRRLKRGLSCSLALRFPKCAALLPTRKPLSVRRFDFADTQEQSARELMIFLPGIGDVLDDFELNGFIARVRERLNHVASRIVNTAYVSGCKIQRSRLRAGFRCTTARPNGSASPLVLAKTPSAASICAFMALRCDRSRREVLTAWRKHRLCCWRRSKSDLARQCRRSTFVFRSLARSARHLRK
jgi:hypothetical protein